MTKILMIEDSEQNPLLKDDWLSELSNANCSAITVHSFKEGLRKIETENFDLVFLDLDIGDTVGVSKMVDIVHRTKDLPILVCSSSEDPLVKDHALELGAAGFLRKHSFNAKLLIAKIQFSIENFKQAKVHMAMFKHNIF